MLKIIIILLLVNTLQLLGEDCELPNGCEQKEFPYFLCDHDKVVTVCTSNPYGVFQDNKLFIPMKNIPCFDYIFSSFTNELEKTIVRTDITYELIIGEYQGVPIYGYKKPGVKIYHLGTDIEIQGQNPGDPIYVKYYEKYLEEIIEIVNVELYDEWDNLLFLFSNYDEESPTDTEESFDNAIEAWTSQCNGCDLNETYLQNCCAKVIWTKDPNKWREVGFDPEKVPAFTSQRTQPPSIEFCKRDCDKSVTYINQTDVYTKQTADDLGNYKNFFFTGDNEKYGWKSFKSVLMHEMGHIFGFEDQYEDNPYSCIDDESIMSNYNHHKHDRGLSEDDKCMYMKMYCWEPPSTGILDFSKNEMEINIAPNPSNKDFNIFLKIEQSQNLIIEIFDYQGLKIIQLENKLFNKGNHFINWKGTDKRQNQLPNGNYFLRISNGNKQISQKLIINR